MYKSNEGKLMCEMLVTKACNLTLNLKPPDAEETNWVKHWNEQFHVKQREHDLTENAMHTGDPWV